MIGVGLYLILLAVLAAGGTVNTLSQAIPRKILDWQAAGEDRTYNRKTVFDYMDGGAEVYLAFDFREAFVRTYQAPSGDDIVLDIFDMGSPEEAYGVFSSDRQDPEAAIGQESTFGPGLLRFWQGRYFVSISSAGDNQKTDKAILELGRAVAPHLGPPGERPPVLKILPPAGLVGSKTSYFHSSISLSNRYFVATENVLHLEKGKTDCVLAEYSEGDEETIKLLLIRYPDGEQAEAAHQSFLNNYLPDAGPDGTAQTENKKWVLGRRHQNFLAVVFEAPSKERAERLFSALRFPST
jgi:hypothetical protein